MFKWLFKRKKKTDVLDVSIKFDSIVNCQKVQQLISENIDLPVTIIVADINLNVVDGSSIWLSSISNIFSTCSTVVILSKDNVRRDLIVSNLKNNITVIQPSDLDCENAVFDHGDIVKILGFLDDVFPNTQNLVVRGSELAVEIAKSNRYYGRLVPYLTNIYEVEDGIAIVRPIVQQNITNLNSQAKTWFIQTPEIKNFLEAQCNINLKTFIYFTPTLPDIYYEQDSIPQKSNVVVISYAGKIQPDWGVLELLECALVLNKRGIDLKVRVISSKISASSHFSEQTNDFINKVNLLLQQPFVEYVKDVNRQTVMKLLNNSNFIWAYRPAYFENTTLELSTKLLEGVSLGIPTICYPNMVNKRVLGEDYPYFMTEPTQLFEIIKSSNGHEYFNNTSNDVKREYSFSYKVELVNKLIMPLKSKSILFAGDDFKFINHFMSLLKSEGFNVLTDQWEWGGSKYIERSKYLYNQADIIFCEWGLANAVWYSQNNYLQKPLFIRIHAQEVRERARKFGAQINISGVTKFIFVSEKIRDDAIRLWSWPLEKTIIIPNYVLVDDFNLTLKNHLTLSLGLVGITPQSKRLDIAIDLVNTLIDVYPNAKLYIKGKRPEEYEWMHAPGRIKELDYYYEQYKRLEIEPVKSAVVFDGFANDMVDWYKKIDFILSPSDHESFHYGLADGVASGCIPILWPWEGASTVYDASWVVNDITDAVQKIEVNVSSSIIQQRQHQNRAMINEKYNYELVSKKLKSLILNDEK